MVYKGFTWNVTYAEASFIQMQMERYLAGKPITKIDEKLIVHLIAQCTIFRELSPDGSSPRHATADA